MVANTKIKVDTELEGNGRSAYTLILVLTLLAFLVRLWGINQHSYWFDEAREVLRSMTPWPDVLFITDGADPPVYRLLLFPIAQMTTHEFWLRFPSALFSGISVYLAYYWLKLVNLPRLGLVTALFMAVSSVQIFYAQEVSQYSFTVFLALLLLISFEQAGQSGTLRDWVGLTVVTVVALYSYYGLAWLLPLLDLHLLWRVWQKRSKQQLISYAVAHLIIGLSIVALYFSMLSLQMNRFSTNKDLEPLFVDPGWQASIRQFDDLFLSGFVQFFMAPFSSIPWPWVPKLFVLLILAGSLYLFVKNQASRLLVVYFWGTVALMFLVRFIGIYPLGGRYALAVLPLFFMLLSAAVLALNRWPVLAYGLGLVLVLFQIFFWPRLAGSVNPWLALPRESLRPAVAYLNEQAAPDDMVFVYYGAGPAYKVYQQDSTLETVYGTWFRSLPLEEKLAEIQEAAGERPHFWLAMSHIHESEDEDLLGGLAASEPAFVVVDSYLDENAAVFLLERVR